jgi:hypothetical protein
MNMYQMHFFRWFFLPQLKNERTSAAKSCQEQGKELQWKHFLIERKNMRNISSWTS